MDLNWPLSSVVYQIYPRSFQDTNGDGIGDLQGIIQHLDYLSELGITAIWLSPIYPSPQADFGYDIANYLDIDPIFGTLADFDELAAKAKGKGIRILIDYVPNHTSSEHSWFKESRISRDNPKHDWYIWVDPKIDGSVPNNWLSVFGGSAWEFDAHRQQYYLHLFDKQQPDLNWRNPAVQEAMFNVLRFWMERGVDGFRVDVPYHLFKDALLRDEPSNPNYIAGTHNHFDSLQHIYTAWLPESMTMMKEFTNVLQEYKDKFMVTEAWGEMSELIKLYMTVGWKWFAPFNFSMITLPWKADVHKQFIDEYDKALGEIYLPCYVLGNHDTPRIVSRIGCEQARVAALLQFTLRGLQFIYNGEEIGMQNGVIPRDKIRDTFELNSPGLGLGRDPQRTPMQWNDQPFAGFSTSEPWLPTSDQAKKINVQKEEYDFSSMLSLYKFLIKLKKHNPIIREGTYIALPQPGDTVFAFLREKDGKQVLILGNFSHTEVVISLPYTNVGVVCSTKMDLQENQKFDLTTFTIRGDEGLIFSIIS